MACDKKTFKDQCDYHFTNMLSILGDEATIEFANGTSIKILCVFKNFYTLIEDPMNDVGVASSRPRLVCKEKDVEGVRVNDRVIIENKKYKITELQSENTGTINLMLNKI